MAQRIASDRWDGGFVALTPEEAEIVAVALEEALEARWHVDGEPDWIFTEDLPAWNNQTDVMYEVLRGLDFKTDQEA